MYSLLFLGFSSFLLSLFLTPLVRDIALRLGLVDRPDGYRKLHKQPVPHLGGVAILASAVGSFAALLLLGSQGSLVVRQGLSFALHLLPAVMVIFALGLVDDIFDVRPWYKLAGQITAAVLAWIGGIRLDAIGGHMFPPEVAFVLTVAWIVAYINAMNLIDGVDGLAAGMALFATITTLIAGLLHGNMALALAAVPLVGALFGFLRYNFNPASIFLGDCGSMTLGLLLGSYGIVWSEKSTTLLGMTAPLLALSVPLLDVGVSIVRRFLTKQPLFRGDQRHIHHRLLSLGLAPRTVVLILYGFCGLAAAASILMIKAHQQYQGLVIIFVCLTAWLGLQHLGYDEFRAMGKLTLGGGFRRQLIVQMDIVDFQKELGACNSVDECWDVLCRAYPRFGFSGAELKTDEAKIDGNLRGKWSVQIDLPGQGYICIFRSQDAQDNDFASVLFLDTIAQAFRRKVSELNQDEIGIPAVMTVD